MSFTSKAVLVFRFLVLLPFLSACSIEARAHLQTVEPQSSPAPVNSPTLSATPFQPQTNTPSVLPPTSTPTATATPLPTSTPVPTDTPIPTDTPVATATPQLVYNPPGDVIAPILLYHHISDAAGGNRYYVPPDVFRTQLQALRDWGYTSITISQLVDVLMNGGDLPPRPVVITFDDGNLDIYQTAFPIMQEMGFVGTFYIVANRLESDYFVTPDQLREMVGAGWEVGDHGMTHSDLTLDYSTLGYEMASSRSILEDALGVKITTFAYPYGKTDEFVTNKVSEYGYLAAMGLGTKWEHTWGSLYYLSRMEVQSSYSMDTFAAMLPWSNR